MATAGFLLTVVAFFAACDTSTPPVVPPDYPPKILNFTFDSTCFNRSYVATIDFDAIDDHSIDSAVIEYGDGGTPTHFLSPKQHYSVLIKRQYQAVGFFNTKLTIYDNKMQIDSKTITVYVYPDSVRLDSLLSPCSGF